jgi:hypothetical protein
MNHKWALRCSICFALVLSFCVSDLVMGQTTNTTGSVLGVVSDPSGAMVPGATLTLKLEAT